jgi:glyoxylase-like metal-dependent hydrolase (beta-lactamase superfamily II)
MKEDEMKARISGKALACIAALAITVVLFRGLSYAGEGLVRITENVYSYVGASDGSASNSFGANAGIVIGKDAIVAVDALVSAKAARKFIGDIRAVSDKPVKYVVNTHSHLDHAFGNSEFAKLGAAVVSHVKCRDIMEKAAEDTLKNAADYGLTDEDTAGTRIAYPTLTFERRMAIDLGGLKAELIFVAPSHTAGSVLVYLPEEKTLFAGDVLFTDFHPFMGEGDIDGWLKTLGYIETLDVERIIPGHGPVSGKEDVAAMKDYLAAFDKKAGALAEKSDDLEYIVAEVKKAVPQKAMGEWLIKANIQMKYMKKK